MSHARSALLAAGVAGLAAPLLAARLASAADPADAPLWRMLAAQAFFAALALLLALRLGGCVRERLGLVRARFSLPTLSAGVLGTLALSGALQFAIEALALAPGSSLEHLESIAAQALPVSPWLALAAFALAPAFAEELLCRGLLQRSLAPRLGRWAVAASAALFALLHLDLVHTPAAFVLGGALGALAWWSGSTWLPIVCHLANNALAAAQQGFPTLAERMPRPQSGAAAVGWLLVSLLGLWAAARLSGTDSAGDEPSA